jgi:hypothetical protein
LISVIRFPNETKNIAVAIKSNKNFFMFVILVL